MQTGRTSRRPTSTARLKSQRVVYIKRDILWKPPTDLKSTFVRWLSSPYVTLNGDEAIEGLQSTIASCCGSLDTYQTLIRPALDEAIAEVGGGRSDAADDSSSSSFVRDAFEAYVRRKFRLASETSVKYVDADLIELRAVCPGRAQWRSRLNAKWIDGKVVIESGMIEVLGNSVSAEGGYDLKVEREVPAGSTLEDLERIEDEMQVEISSFLLAWTIAEEQPYARILAPDSLPNLPAILAHQRLSNNFS